LLKPGDYAKPLWMHAAELGDHLLRQAVAQVFLPRKVLKTLEQASQQRPDLSHSIALVLAGLGEKDQAFARLEQAYQAHDGSLILLQVNPLLDPLRSDARFQDLVRRVFTPTASKR